jgi:hypothetical protein
MYLDARCRGVMRTTSGTRRRHLGGQNSVREMNIKTLCRSLSVSAESVGILIYSSVLWVGFALTLSCEWMLSDQDHHFMWSGGCCSSRIYVQDVPGGKVSILGGHSIGHFKQNVYVYVCPIPNGFRDRAISLYSTLYTVQTSKARRPHAIFSRPTS